MEITSKRIIRRSVKCLQQQDNQPTSKINKHFIMKELPIKRIIKQQYTRQYQQNNFIREYIRKAQISTQIYY